MFKEPIQDQNMDKDIDQKRTYNLQQNQEMKQNLRLNKAEKPPIKSNQGSNNFDENIN